MKTTYDWLREYCDSGLPVEELARRLSMAGCLIEEVHPLGGDFLLAAEVTSNRPDLLNTIGIAREVHALTGAPLRFPSTDFACGDEKISSTTSVEVLDPALCPRYTARLIRGVKVGPSPDWLRQRLEAIGVRSINNVVDITNYVMFECGQPLHAFDFDKLHGQRIVVRRPKEGEKLVSIDGTECDLTPSMLVIADADRPVAVAGVMGGLDTEISDRTTNVLLEAAQFENTNIRRTSRALGLASDSSYRFERGVCPAGVETASRRATHLIQQIAGGMVAEGIIDIWAQRYVARTITLRGSRMRHVLGAAAPLDIARCILERLGFTEPRMFADELSVCVPPFRASDVYREIDLIEEVIRIYGYDKIPESGTLPVTVGRVSKFERVSDLVRELLPARGFYEVVTNSFCDEATACLVSPWTQAEPIPFRNTIRRDENRLRVSLLPCLLAVKQTNLAHGVGKSPVFEISRVFLKKPPRTSGDPSRDDALPEERHTLAILSEDDLLQLKGILECVADAAGIGGKARFEPAEIPFFREKRAAKITVDGEMLGVMGEPSDAMCQRFDISHPPCMAELDFDLLVRAASLERIFSKLPAHPGAVRDLAVVVDEAVPWSRIEGCIRDLRIPILERMEFFDIYRGKQIPPGKKSIAFSLAFRAPDRTLTSDEVETARQACIQALAAIGGQLRG